MVVRKIRARVSLAHCFLILVALACLLAGTSAPGQVSTSLGGTITDATGAVVPNAQVQIKNEDTGQTVTVRTNSTGQYQVPNLPVGNYEITVTIAGFAVLTRKATTGVGQATSTDFTLQVGASTSETVTEGSGNLVTSRSLLDDNSREEKGYGLYSYILFGTPPNDATRDRYLAVLRSFINFPSTEDMVKQVSRKQLNVTYLPVKGQPNSSSGDALLQAYDYARAAGLLARISCKDNAAPCGPLLGGPYIVSTTKPLSDQASLSQHFLYQNLSSVPARIVPLWVDEFMKQSAMPDFWQKRNGPQVALKLRTAIAVLAEASGPAEASAGAWKKTLATILSWH
jgi:hypothetical protein